MRAKIKLLAASAVIAAAVAQPVAAGVEVDPRTSLREGLSLLLFSLSERIPNEKVSMLLFDKSCKVFPEASWCLEDLPAEL